MQFFKKEGEKLQKPFLVGIGGFFGAVSRYLVDSFVKEVAGVSFPLGTLLVNASGSFLLGFLFATTLERVTHNHTLSLLLGYGFIGAYTTFSTFMLDNVRLVESGGLTQAMANIFLSLFFGLAAVYAGLWMGKIVV